MQKPYLEAGKIVNTHGVRGEVRIQPWADDAAFLLGHNLIAFDLPQLRAAQPNLRLLGKPVIDTLRLNPLAFPKNPYHHLVKHYQDGQLLADRKNDPLLDAELALQVFCDQELALRQMQQSSPDLLLAWHWLTTLDQSVSGLNRFFMMVREAPRPGEENANAAMRRLFAGKTCAPAAASRRSFPVTRAAPSAASTRCCWACRAS